MSKREHEPPAPEPDDKVDEEIWESFPASDPPSFMPPGPAEKPRRDKD